MLHSFIFLSLFALAFCTIDLEKALVEAFFNETYPETAESFLPEGVSIRKCTKPDVVALTVDDGPYVSMAELLKTLDLFPDQKLTFFVTGVRYKNTTHNPNNPKLIEQAISKGHDIAHHSYGHQNYVTMPEEMMKQDFQKMDKILSGINGSSKVFRPPFGNINAAVKQYVESFGYQIVSWSADSFDWKIYSGSQPLESLAHVTQGMCNQDIILMHDTHKRSPDVLKSLLTQFAARKLRSVSISECLGDNVVHKYKTNGQQTYVRRP
ncbi:glycoside hydrolase/deacetylase [Rozella allomycis CSF55]|uniref:Glycoside hydrolase/deacetylase n=1 Tax=Rozella allomycis (strain CSF55) TaxID=988480 RepID=A0A075AUM8_ROZAC|nr:Glycoside hydrolase/deacetylase, beta/alpha-barrel domain-containing protein [Rozella allomycis CSF55]RKP21170.1 glycoside hydrolase/deacetylase [Rozella allomycis CSF55]|eukprot:EPZ32222.1 Glycoside hydrolase/deacetylase, beta/alpha-barrel domain-containing protein [Rozella allomycis CSF55]